jgi:phage/plasmid primase-like uncharacterized protein
VYQGIGAKSDFNQGKYIIMDITNHLKNALTAATGHWILILQAAGISPQFLQNKHGPCPICGGKDRFRLDNIDGRGTYFCNQCGAGDGLNLLKKFTGFATSEALSFIEKYLGWSEFNSKKSKHVMTHITPIVAKALSSRSVELQRMVAYIQSRAIMARPEHPYLVLKKIPATGLRSIQRCSHP